MKTQQHGSAAGWIGRPVPNTNLRIWIKGTPEDLDPYEPLFAQVWGAFGDFFRYPDDDDGPTVITNPDGAIDFYLINGGEVDPRSDNCLGANSNPVWCTIRGTGAVTVPTGPRSYRKSSAYVMVNRATLDEDTLVDTIAHELAHVSQFGYDYEETSWLKDSTASWVAYKVVKKLRRNPRLAYPWAKQFVQGLHHPLDRTTGSNDYDSWLFFFYASTELGDPIVEEVWRKAESGLNHIDAVNAAIPLNEHFARFTVLNWNHDSAPQYKEWDPTFPADVIADPALAMPAGYGMFVLNEPVQRLAARYYYFSWETERRVTFQNLYYSLPDAHVWALKKINGQWHPPEDWTQRDQIIFCRDEPTEKVTDLVVIVSNSHIRNPLPAGHPKPRALVEDVGCAYLEGWSTSRLRLRDETQDLSYVSSRASLRFRPRTVQDMEGNVQYDLLPTSVTWTANGTQGDCRVEGQAVVTIPSYVDQPLDPTRQAWGYLNVVGADGGDFHSVQVSAVDPSARMTKTCPGDPPIVSKVPFDSVWLLHVLSEKNTHNGGPIYRGKQSLDPANPQASMPMTPGEALKILPSAPGAGAFITPEIQAQLKEAQEALERIAAESGGKVVYTFEWELKPVAGTSPPSSP